MSLVILDYIRLGKESRVRAFLNDGVYVDAGNYRKERPLLIAAKYGHERIVKMLLKIGADPNLQSNAGMTALMAASDQGHNECVRDLLRYGALWKLKELNGLTPLSRIVRLSQTAYKDKTPIPTSAIKADPSTKACSVDVFHIFSLKDCVVYNTRCLAKIQIRPSCNSHRVAESEDDDWITNEYKMLRFLLHPHVITPHFISISPDLKYNVLITEPMKYGNLYHVLYETKKTLQTKLVKMATDGILKALVYLTSKNIVHNFVNSTSVYVTRGWVTKLGNFEYAHIDGKDAEHSMSVEAVEYHFPYMAPELHLYEDSMQNFATDMYSFGCLVWELYGLRRPWSWLERTEIICLSQVKHPITLPMSHCWPESIKSLIKLATKQRPYQRPTFKTLYSEIFKPLTKLEKDEVLESCNEDTASEIHFEDLKGSYTSVNGKRKHGFIEPTPRSIAMLNRANPSGIKTHCESHCLCASHQGNYPQIKLINYSNFSSEHVMNIETVDSVELSMMGDEYHTGKETSIKPPERDELLTPKTSGHRKSIKPPARDEFLTPETTGHQKSIKQKSNIHQKVLFLAPDITKHRKSIKPPARKQTSTPDPNQTTHRKSVRPPTQEDSFDSEPDDFTEHRKSIGPNTYKETFTPKHSPNQSRKSIRPPTHNENVESEPDFTEHRKSIKPPTRKQSSSPDRTPKEHQKSVRTPTHKESFDSETNDFIEHRKSIRPPKHESSFESEPDDFTEHRKSIRSHTRKDTFTPEPNLKPNQNRNSIRSPTQKNSFEPEPDFTEHRKSIKPPTRKQSSSPDRTPKEHQKSVRTPTHKESFESETNDFIEHRKSIRPPTHESSFESEPDDFTEHRQSIRSNTRKDTFTPEPNLKPNQNRNSIRPPTQKNSFEPEPDFTEHRKSIKPPTRKQSSSPDRTPKEHQKSVRTPTHKESFESETNDFIEHRKSIRPPTHESSFESEPDDFTEHRQSIRSNTRKDTFTPEPNHKPNQNRNSIRPPTHEDSFESEPDFTVHEGSFKREAKHTPHRKSIRAPTHEENFESEQTYTTHRNSIKPPTHKETFPPEPKHAQHRKSIKPPIREKNLPHPPKVVVQQVSTTSEFRYAHHREPVNNQSQFETEVQQQNTAQYYQGNHTRSLSTKIENQNKDQIKRSMPQRQETIHHGSEYAAEYNKEFDNSVDNTAASIYTENLYKRKSGMSQRSEIVRNNHQETVNNNERSHVNEMNDLYLKGYPEHTQQRQTVPNKNQRSKLGHRIFQESVDQSTQYHTNEHNSVDSSHCKFYPDCGNHVSQRSRIASRSCQEPTEENRQCYPNENIQNNMFAQQGYPKNTSQSSEIAHQNLQEPSQHNAKYISNDENHHMNNLSGRVYTEKTNQKQPIKGTCETAGVIDNGRIQADGNTQYVQQRQARSKNQTQFKLPRQLDLAQYIENLHKSNLSTKANKESLNQKELIDGLAQNIIQQSSQEQSDKSTKEKPSNNNKKKGSKKRKFQSSESEDFYEEPYELIESQRPITIYNHFTIQTPPGIIESLQAPPQNEYHYEDVSTNTADSSKVLKIKKLNNKGAQNPMLPDWSRNSPIDLFSEPMVSKGSFVKEFLGKIKRDSPSSFEKIEHKLGSLFDKDDSIYELVSNPIVLSDKMERDAQVQEIFEMAGNHERKNWAKLEATNREQNSKKLYCMEHLIEFGDHSVNVKGGQGGRSLITEKK